MLLCNVPSVLFIRENVFIFGIASGFDVRGIHTKSVFAEHLEGNYFKFRDVFDDLLVSMKNKNKRVMISPFMIPYMPILGCIPDNVLINKLEQSYNDISRLNSNLTDIAIENLLSMLLAYDKTCRKIHLRAANILAHWLIDNNSDHKSASIHKLNLFQTLLRERQLNDDESDELSDIALNLNDHPLESPQMPY